LLGTDNGKSNRGSLRDDNKGQTTTTARATATADPYGMTTKGQATTRATARTKADPYGMTTKDRQRQRQQQRQTQTEILFGADNKKVMQLILGIYRIVRLRR
jgi:hypothetical protein